MRMANSGLKVVLRTPSPVQLWIGSREKSFVEDPLFDLLAKGLERPLLLVGSRLFREVGAEPIRNLSHTHGAVCR